MNTPVCNQISAMLSDEKSKVGELYQYCKCHDLYELMARIQKNFPDQPLAATINMAKDFIEKYC